MEYEKLALEVRAHFAGLSVIKPPFVVGSSGVRHRFSFLSSRGPELFAFDICEKVGVEEVIQTFAKRLDTNVKACVVNLGGRIDSEALQLASVYGISVISPGEIQNCFARQAVRVENVSIHLRGPFVLEA
jgi:hypothetical protein